MTLRICAPDIFSGDAVGNHCLGIARMAERLGWEVQIYARHFDVASRAINDIEALYADLREEDTLLLSYSIFDPNLDTLLALRCRKVCYFHGITSPELLREFEPRTADLCEQAIGQLPRLAAFDTVVANSRFSANCLPAGVSTTSVVVIPPVFADMPAFAEGQTQAACASRDINLLMVGRVVPHKRIEDAIDVLANLVKRDINVSLSVVGSVPNYDYTKFLLNRARALGVLERIDFTGMVDDADLSAAFDRASALLSLSRHEGFCVPALEAMHVGMPVFVRGGTATEEICPPDSVLAAEADAAAWADVICARLDELERTNPSNNRYVEKADEILQRTRDSIWQSVLERVPSGDVHVRA
ncbi:Glycosyl transferases group 1 [Paraburkholderia fungorum]|uniref:Glycosyl transferases group 1 n=1 Tax=Paraburkholderia fungorum TaxID=134537 RepID=A0A1H0ZZL1_9BURK|nr:glycosyltransferase family 4 protein [Paraburkholderia fungorum]SDQ32820.1 Glycosyl transferases group 1 [Paraburkholderia fungorum]